MTFLCVKILLELFNIWNHPGDSINLDKIKLQHDMRLDEVSVQAHN